MRSIVHYYGHKFFVGVKPQQRAIDALRKKHPEKEEEQVVIQLEWEKTRVFAFFSCFEDFYYYKSNVVRANRHFYALNRSYECEFIVSRFYADIEWITEMTPDPLAMQRLKMLQSVIREMIALVIGEAYNESLDAQEFFVIDHTRAKNGKMKNSFHMHFPVQFEHNAKGCMYDFVHQMVVPILKMNKLATVIGATEAENQFILDVGVYTKNRAFRILGSHKKNAQSKHDWPSLENMRLSVPCVSSTTPSEFPLITERMIADALVVFREKYNIETKAFKVKSAQSRIKSAMKAIPASFPGAVTHIQKLLNKHGATDTIVQEDGDHYRGVAGPEGARVCLISKQYGEHIVHSSNCCRITVSPSTGSVTYMCFSIRGKGHTRVENRMSRLIIGQIPDALLNRYRALQWQKSQAQGEIEGIDQRGRQLPRRFHLDDHEFIPNDDLCQMMDELEEKKAQVDKVPESMHEYSDCDLFDSDDEDGNIDASVLDLFDLSEEENGALLSQASNTSIADLFAPSPAAESQPDKCKTEVKLLLCNNHRLDDLLLDADAVKLIELKHVFPILRALAKLISTFNGVLNIIHDQPKEALVANLIFCLSCINTNVAWGSIPMSHARLIGAPHAVENRQECDRYLRSNATAICKHLTNVDVVCVPDDHGWITFVNGVLSEIEYHVSDSGVVEKNNCWVQSRVSAWDVLSGWLPKRSEKKVQFQPRPKKKKVLKQTKIVCTVKPDHSIPRQTLHNISKLPSAKKRVAYAQLDFGWIMQMLGFDDNRREVSTISAVRSWKRMMRVGEERIHSIDRRHLTNFSQYIGCQPVFSKITIELCRIARFLGIKVILSPNTNKLLMIKL